MMARTTTVVRILLAALVLLLLFTGIDAQAQSTRATVGTQPEAARVPPPGDDDPPQPPFNAATPINQSVPGSMTAGGVYTVTINMKNTGNTTWTSGTAYSLGSRNPFDNATWGGGRVGLPGDIPPGGFAQFTFQVTAPAAAGSYNFQWGMVQDGVEWFGTPSENLVINVVAAPRNGSQFVTQSVPASMTTGAQYPVSLTFSNTGNTTWDPTNGKYVLLAVNPVNNETWVYSRIPLSGPVAPGQQTTVAWTTRAPSTPGTYNFQWIILQEGVELIGTPSNNVAVVVSAPAPVNGAQVLSFLVSPMTQGQNATVTVTLQNTGGTTWSAGSNYKLGSQNPGENLTWGVQRIDLASDVAPGQSYTFAFPITAPAAGTYTMQWQMMQRYVEWFGGVASAPVTVNPPPSGDTVTYIHTDALGSPVARSDSAGNVISRTSYEPYGRTASGVTPTIGFTGHVNDADTGLVYMQQRYYDPVAGRFLSVDPVTTDTSSGGGFNRYAYAANSPYKYIDPDGREEARTIEPTCIPGLCTTVGAPSRSSSGASGGGTSGTAVGSGASPSQPSPYDPGGQYEVNIMGDPVNPNYPGVGAAQVIVGGTLVAGLGLAGVEGGAFIASQVQGNAMRGMSNEVLKGIIKAEGGVAQLNAKGIFGTGLPGATSALALAQRAAPYSLPVGLQVRALQAYRVIAERSLNEVQSLRIKIIDQYLKIMGR